MAVAGTRGGMWVGLKGLMGVIYLMRLILYQIHPSSVFSAANHCLSKRSSDFVSVLLQYRIPIGKSVTQFYRSQSAPGFDNFQRVITCHRKGFSSQHMCIVKYSVKTASIIKCH